MIEGRRADPDMMMEFIDRFERLRDHVHEASDAEVRQVVSREVKVLSFHCEEKEEEEDADE